MYRLFSLLALGLVCFSAIAETEPKPGVYVNSDSNGGIVVTNIAADSENRLDADSQYEQLVEFARVYSQQSEAGLWHARAEELHEDLRLLTASLLKQKDYVSFQINKSDEIESAYYLCVAGDKALRFNRCFSFHDDNADSAAVGMILEELFKDKVHVMSRDAEASVLFSVFQYSNQWKIRANQNSGQSSSSEMRAHQQWVEEQLRGICGAGRPGSNFVPGGNPSDHCHTSGVRTRERSGQMEVFGYYKHRDGSRENQFHVAYFPLTGN